MKFRWKPWEGHLRVISNLNFKTLRPINERVKAIVALKPLTALRPFMLS
jgi:hypothetical protein